MNEIGSLGQTGMLIINADDWGRSGIATDNTLMCYKNGRVTSASAMVFSMDSERAAEIAQRVGLQTGLHLNFTERFTERKTPTKVRDRQQRIASFLNQSKYRSLVYNPFLRDAFDYVYKAQCEEYLRLYSCEPTHIDGHHHMHLSMNMLLGGLIPGGSRMRRTFTFSADEKSVTNLIYRRIVNMVIERRYVCTNRFYSIAPIQKRDRLITILEHAKSQNVELMVHPAQEQQFEFLMSGEFLSMLSGIEMGSYSALN